MENCCLGVLCKVLGWQLGETDRSIVVNGEDVGYDPFNNLLGRDEVNNLWEANDRNKVIPNAKRDYSNVIPLIEKLETTD